MAVMGSIGTFLRIPRPTLIRSRDGALGAQSMSPVGLLNDWYPTRMTRFCVGCREYVVPVLGYCMFCGDIPVGYFDLYAHEFMITVRQGVLQLPPDPAARIHPRAARRAPRH